MTALHDTTAASSWKLSGHHIHDQHISGSARVHNGDIFNDYSQNFGKTSSLFSYIRDLAYSVN